MALQAAPALSPPISWDVGLRLDHESDTGRYTDVTVSVTDEWSARVLCSVVLFLFAHNTDRWQGNTSKQAARGIHAFLTLPLTLASNSGIIMNLPNSYRST